MSRLWASAYCAVLSLMICGVCGCIPAGDERLDEQKDMHYQRGRSLSGSQDFRGAVDEFEKAIEVNPHSASAHFELAWLCEEKLKDYPAAIYHYQKHLALQPNSTYRNQAKDRIRVCIVELAKAEFSPPDVQNLRREIERLNAENVLLRQQIDVLKTQVAAAVAAAAAVRPPTVTSIVSNSSYAMPNSYSTPTWSGSNGAPTTATARPHFHVVKSGETVASIALQYNLKLAAVLAANPKVTPKRLRPGQTLILP